MIFDPFSVLLSSSIEIGSNNVIYPCVTMTCCGAGSIRIGNRNIFHANVTLDASHGPIVVGSENQFGDGGSFVAKANRQGADIMIGDSGRYQGGASVFGSSRLETGSQILGQISVDSCHLEAGESFRHSDPDLRAGLLKGAGAARNLHVPAGHVIVGDGSGFSQDRLEKQAVYHPK